MSQTLEKRRLQSYPSPLNVKKVLAMAEKQGVSQSKIVNEALTMFFKSPPESSSIFLHKQ